MTEIDVWRSAAQLVKQHGDMAEFEAAHHTDRMIERGDVAGEAVWKRIQAAIRKLQRATPTIGEPLH